MILRKHLLHSVVDRRTGVGSRVKGYPKYGGKWLKEICGKRSMICIINERMASQMCLYCRQELEHSLFVEEVDGRIKKERYASIRIVSL